MPYSRETLERWTCDGCGATRVFEHNQLLTRQETKPCGWVKVIAQDMHDLPIVHKSRSVFYFCHDCRDGVLAALRGLLHDGEAVTACRGRPEGD